MIVEIRTTRYNEQSSSNLSHFRDYTIRKTNDGTIDLLIIIKDVDHKGVPSALQDLTKVVNKTFENSNRFIHEFFADMDDNEDFTYCEIEIKCFVQRKRYDKEFKLCLHTEQAYEDLLLVRKFINLVLLKQSMLEQFDNDLIKSNTKSHVVELEYNDKPIVSIDLDEYKDKIQRVAEEKMDDAISFIQEKMSDSLESISNVSGSRKKKSFLGRLFRK